MKRIKLLASIGAALVLFAVLAGCASMQLVSLETDSVEGPRQVRQGQNINPSDIKVYGIYKDESRKLVSVKAENIVFDSGRVGPQTVRIRISNHEVGFQTEVMALTGITVASPPTTTAFRQGQDANWTGLQIRGEWDQMGGDTIPAGSYQITGYNKDQAGRQVISVAYQGKTTTFNVEVRGLTSIRVTQPPTKSPQSGALDLTGLRVAGTWEGFPEQEITITAGNVTGYNQAREGTQTLTVTVSGRTATFNINVMVLDPAINGAWVNVTTIGDGTLETRYTFNNGNYEYALGTLVTHRGTCTTAGGRITFTGTHFNGNVLALTGIMTGEDPTQLDNRFYTRDEVASNSGIPPKTKENMLKLFEPDTRTYSVSGNTLTITNTDGQATAYTKR